MNSPSPFRPTRADALLLACAVAGFALFALLLPGQHPYSGVDYSGRAASLEGAERFLAEAGYVLPGSATPDVDLRMNGILLDTLQHALGRPEALRLAQSDSGRVLGTLHWRVLWSDPDPSVAQPARTLALVWLTAEGQVLAFEMRQQARFERVVPERGDDAPVQAIPDTFRAAPGGVSAAQVQRILQQTAFGGAGLALDSLVSTASTYRAHLSGLVATRHAKVEMQFDREGHLLRLESDFAEPVTAVGATTPRELSTISVIGLFVLLIVVVMVAFFKRLRDRLIDTRAALRDALWMALAGMGWMVSATSVPIMESVPSVLFALGAIVFNTIIGALGAAFIVFAASGAANSIARPLWPHRLASLSLLRAGAWYDARVGAAVVRGFAGAGLTLGLLTLALVVLPQIGLRVGNASAPLPDEVTLSASVFVVSFYALVAILQVYGVVLILGGGLARKLGGGVYVLIAVVLAALQFVVLTEEPGWQFALHLIPAGIATWLFKRHDALAALVLLIVYAILWDLSYTWMGTGVPGLVGAVVTLAMLALLFGISLAVFVRGREVRENQALVPSYIREREYEARMERELEIAHNVQMTFLPRRMPRVQGLDVAALCLPAMEVGGDYYDFVELDDRRLALVIGDVSGKGIQAAFYMTLVKGFIRTLAREHMLPDEVLRRANRLFYECAPRGTFISMIYGIVDVERRTFSFARAGHNPVLLHRAPSRQAEMLQPPGLALGLDPGPRFDAALETQTLHLSVGDTLVLYTDGFSEAMSMERALYGDEKLAEQASKSHGGSARHLLDALTHGVNAFMNGAPQHDDMTMMVLRFTAAPISTAPHE